MARIKMTPEEKAARDAVRKAEGKVKREAARQAKNEARQAEWKAKTIAAREASLALVDEATKVRFLKKYQDFLATSIADAPEIEVSIFSQYMNYGKLSEKQIRIIADHDKKLRLEAAEQEMYEEYECEKQYNFKLKLLSATCEENTSTNYYASNTVMVYRFVNTSNQRFKIKSNSKKLYAVFNEVHKWYKFTATVSFIMEGNKYINLTHVKFT